MAIVPDEVKAEFLKALGARLARARTMVGLDAHPRRKVSQQELGDVVNLSDVAVGAWEAGRNEPSLFDIKRMGEHMGVRPAWIAFEDGPMRAEGAVLRDPPTKPSAPSESGPTGKSALYHTLIGSTTSYPGNWTAVKQ